ncbi:hypothetical protein P2T68_28150 [Pseudomonas sp. G11]|uniref:hypothetical protein n=1 Tax=Pseudomonas sp. G11 TaxID=528343 RepID=UPI002402B268|nr:hypothetical protein [Pseudomonas sp. G11]WEX14450.1 hypothetical protein P2T68_28150 [Pseudomonas sp. G11]
MAIEDTKELKVTSSLQQANAYIAKGWTLIGTFDYMIEDSSMSRYTLAWQKAGEPADVPWQSGW